MSKMTKVLLVLSVSCLAAGLVFVTGLVNVGEVVALYACLPAGAVFFELFLISLSLQAESALFDEEQRTAAAVIGSAAPVGRNQCCEPKQASKETLTTAHAH
jgi:hypothetical protein